MGPLAAAWPAITEQLLIRSLPPVDGLDIPDDLRQRAEAGTPIAAGELLAEVASS